MLKFALLVTLAVASYGASIPKEKISEMKEYIIRGKDTDITEAPYQVAMYKSGRFVCGGAIVAPTKILTVAGCVIGEPSPQITFRAGSTLLNSGGVVVQAKEYWVHPKYKYTTMDYDIAVVEITEPLEFSASIQPIELVSSEPSEGSEVKAGGWGLLSDNGAVSNVLQTVVIHMISRETCSRYLSPYTRFTPRMICAADEGKDACKGDGALEYNGKLAGLSSFGVGCAREELPGGYTNIADPEISDFIRQYANI